MIEGTIVARRLPSGLNLCVSDLINLRDNARAGSIQQSLTVALCLEGAPIRYGLEHGVEIELNPGMALAVGAADETRMTSTYRRGERSRTMVIQICPCDLRDIELSERLDTLVKTSATLPLVANQRALALARTVFASPHTGVVARLLAESCALEFLAATIDADDRRASQSSAIHPRDVAKIMRVRDRLLAQLDADHRLCDLARDVGMSVSSLKDKFAAVTGQPVIQFLRDQRLDRARERLRHDGWTVAQAAHYVGYRHAANFSTAYRKRFGMSPSDR